MLVLESEAAALERGARPLCRIVTTGAAFDASASAWSWGTGAEQLGRQLRRMFERAALDPADIDLIVSGASGAVAGDRLEALTLRAAWKLGPVSTPDSTRALPLPPVVAPKGTLGEFGGTQVAAAVLAAAGTPFGPTPGFRHPDFELGIVAHDGRELAPPRRVLASSLAAGGAAAWVVLERTL